MIIKEPEKATKEAKKSWGLSPVQKGLISLGLAGGIIYALKKNKSTWGVIGWAWIGSMVGGGIGQIIKEFKKEDETADD